MSRGRVALRYCLVRFATNTGCECLVAQPCIARGTRESSCISIWEPTATQSVASQLRRTAEYVEKATWVPSSPRGGTSAFQSLADRLVRSFALPPPGSLILFGKHTVGTPRLRKTTRSESPASAVQGWPPGVRYSAFALVCRAIYPGFG